MNLNPVGPPFPGGRLLLHACCAPCSGNVFLRLRAMEIPFLVFFHNPNVHPVEEYLRRKDEMKRFASQSGVGFVDADSSRELWEDATSALSTSPERGARCLRCFALRLRASASFAKKNGFDVFATTLGVSRWKDFNQIRAAGVEAESEVRPGPRFWDVDWRKGGGSDESARIARDEGFYRQRYCGCLFSASRRLLRTFKSYSN